MAEPLALEVVLEDPAWLEALPDAPSLATHALQIAANAERASGEVCVLLTSSEAMRALNARWRGADYPTNVLSFPAAEAAGAGLGDIALGLGVLREEAQAQGKSLRDHFLHLLVHGLLHLLGYDHETDGQAQIMEGRERAILAGLAVPDPYLER